MKNPYTSKQIKQALTNSTIIKDKLEDIQIEHIQLAIRFYQKFLEESRYRFNAEFVSVIVNCNSGLCGNLNIWLHKHNINHTIRFVINDCVYCIFGAFPIEQSAVAFNNNRTKYRGKSLKLRKLYAKACIELFETYLTTYRLRGVD